MLWILGGVMLALVALLLTRVGATVVYDGTAHVTIRFGWCSFALKDSPEKPAKQPKKKKEKQKKPKKPKKKIDFPLVKDGIVTLTPVLLRTLKRTWCAIRIHPLDVSCILGGADDPGGTAQTFGQLQALVWSLLPALERCADIPDPHVHLDMDFQSPQTALHAKVGITARIGSLLCIALGLLIPAITWYTGYQNHNDTENTTTRK